MLTQLCVTPDEKYIISCGSDGVIVVWAVSTLALLPPGVKERILNLPPPAQEMLVTREQLEVRIPLPIMRMVEGSIANDLMEKKKSP